jgi:F-type H+-transporting ATPase subunit alpha
MAEIKPAEISAILRKQVEGFESGATLEEVGTVLLEMVLLVFTGFNVQW